MWRLPVRGRGTGVRLDQIWNPNGLSWLPVGAVGEQSAMSDKKMKE